MLLATIGPLLAMVSLQGAGATQTGAHDGVIVQLLTQGRQAKRERRPLNNSQEAPVQEAQGAQEAQEASTAAAQGAQSCADAPVEANIAAKATQRAVSRILMR